ncbi:hypothetical protein PL11201_660084 [Planktothrix sp. PCC 11201]|nr:hypothetical protein PL11201_100012 [Planktothrix sp. PCC 11201]SKB14541.1 hypothetical protein PL11201_660084 [Planktothrix sp. PCC 11201]
MLYSLTKPTIEVDAYTSCSSLIKYLKKVLENLGQEYAINFV